MILGLLRRRRAARIAIADRIRRSADLFVAACGDDLHTAFWRAHDGAANLSLSQKDRRMWRALAADIDRRRPPGRARADTATRMLFRDLKL